MKKTNKRKLGVVLTNTFKFSSKKQFDLFADFMRKYKMDLDEDDFSSLGTQKSLKEKLQEIEDSKVYLSKEEYEKMREKVIKNAF